MKFQKRLSAAVLKCSYHDIVFDTSRLDKIKDAISREDVRKLVSQGIIGRKKINGPSRYGARKILIKKKKGRKNGMGSRKGSTNARSDSKRQWINLVRLQRQFLKRLRNSGKISKKDFYGLYLKIKGGFFRNLKHLKMYVTEKGILKK